MQDRKIVLLFFVSVFYFFLQNLKACPKYGLRSWGVAFFPWLHATILLSNIPPPPDSIDPTLGTPLPKIDFFHTGVVPVFYFMSVSTFLDLFLRYVRMFAEVNDFSPSSCANLRCCAIIIVMCVSLHSSCELSVVYKCITLYRFKLFCYGMSCYTVFSMFGV